MGRKSNLELLKESILRTRIATAREMGEYYYGVYCMTAILTDYVQWYKAEEEADYSKETMERAVLMEVTLFKEDDNLIDGDLDVTWQRAIELYGAFKQWDNANHPNTSELDAMKNFIEEEFLTLKGGI